MSHPIETRIVQVDSQNPDLVQIRQAAEMVRAGRLVAFPTETVYGLGANALDEAAITRIYHAKQRPAGDPVIAHIYQPEQLEILAIQIPDSAYRLAERFWPGPLTLVLQRAPGIPANIATGRTTVAVRMPAHPVALALLAAANVPVAAPSANLFSRPSATTAAHVLEDLRGQVDLVLDGGPTTIGVESTVVDLTGAMPQILRPGGVSRDDLRAILADIQLAPRYTNPNQAEIAPGQMLKHYAPRAQVKLFTGARAAVLVAMVQATRQYQAAGRRIGVLVADEDADYWGEFLEDQSLLIARLGSYTDLVVIGHNLFAALRALDAAGVTVILTRDFGRQGLGAAVWDRLLRAAEGQVVVVD